MCLVISFFDFPAIFWTNFRSFLTDSLDTWSYEWSCDQDFTKVIYCWVNSLILCFYLCVIDVWIHAETADSCKYNLTIRHSFCKLVKLYCADNYTDTPISSIRAPRTYVSYRPCLSGRSFRCRDPVRKSLG